MPRTYINFNPPHPFAPFLTVDFLSGYRKEVFFVVLPFFLLLIFISSKILFKCPKPGQASATEINKSRKEIRPRRQFAIHKKNDFAALFTLEISFVSAFWGFFSASVGRLLSTITKGDSRIFRRPATAIETIKFRNGKQRRFFFVFASCERENLERHCSPKKGIKHQRTCRYRLWFDGCVFLVFPSPRLSSKDSRRQLNSKLSSLHDRGEMRVCAAFLCA